MDSVPVPSKTLVTVFGGAGFLGRHTVRALARAGYRVRVAVRKPASAYFLMPMGHVGQIQPFRCDAADPDQVAAALEGAQAAINLTGILYPHGGLNFESAHVEAAATIADAARNAGLSSLVHISAIGADPDAQSRYASSKGEGERRVRENFPAAAILRPSLLFGPEDRFFNKFASLARFLPALPLVGGGHTRFQPLFVGDAAAAILACLRKTETCGKTFELGGPTTYTFKELLQFILHETGRRRLLVPVPFFLASIKAFFLQASRILGIEPLLTPDQVRLLRSDNVVREGMPGIADLGIEPVAMEAIVPGYLWRFRPKGQYQAIAAG
ncbi:MAG: complex I NDUFA9 subunit family protein [Alphaproteobacteria bacterium]|nr:complex I NDUFA9 subunit family protein [Alphaproteobacteria bacterium]MBV9692065.1 complex I NDUFA9 subunit family protein [Alphaproteobacteria bacterium]